jgi:hypothetical protein
MQYWRSAVISSLVLILVVFLASCGGGHSNSVGPITSITLTPNPTISLNQSDVIAVTAAATDAKGHAVTNQTFTFNSNNASVQVSNPTSTTTVVAALLCAGGQWEDSNKDPSKGLANPVICAGFPGPSPASPPVFNTGTATITVTAQGVTSNAVTVSVHPKVARVVVNPANPACVPQGQPISYSAQAFDISGNDVTGQVGNFTWSIVDSSIGTLANGAATTSNSVVAALPGATTVTATVNATNPVNSVAAVFQECAVASITITPSPNVFTPSPAPTTTPPQQMTAVVTDTSGNSVNNVPLTWTSSQPVTASVNSSGLVTPVAPGTSSITASCALGSGCNKNQNALVTSNLAVASVSGSSATTVFATGTATTSLVPIDTTTNTAGAAIVLPGTPNSLVFDPTGNNAYLGSNNGLIVMNATSNPPVVSKTVPSATGKVLAVSPNGQLVLLGNSTGSTFLFNNSANTLAAVSITGAVAADFSPDGSEVVVADSGGVRTLQGTTVRTVSNSTVATSVSFLANGSLAYLAATGAPSVVACNGTLHTPGVASGTPQRVKTFPDGSKMLATTPPNTLQVIAVSISGNTCPPTIGETLTSLTFPSSATAHNQIIVTPDGSHAYFPSDIAGSLMTYDGTVTGSVTLSSGTAKTTTGGATLDSASVYVGVNDGGNSGVHRINVSAGTDAAQVVTNDANNANFIPDLVAVRPK